MKHIFLTLSVSIALLMGVNHQNAKAQQHSDTAILQIVNAMSPDSLQSYMLQLEGFGSRFAIVPNHRDVAQWICNKLISYGYADAHLDSFMVKIAPNPILLVYDTIITLQYNVVATLQGLSPWGETMIFGGHYDSYSGDSSMINAPGADDNASGVAAMLETARILQQANFIPHCNIRFMAFGIEEFGLYGSFYDAGETFGSGTNLKLMINNDMIAYSENNDTLIICKVGNYSSWVSDMVNQTYQIYNKVWPIFHAVSFSSDFYPYNEAGYAVAGFHHHAPYQYYHTYLDKVSNCDMEYMTRASRFTCSLLLNADRELSGVSTDMVSDKIFQVYPCPFRDGLNIKAFKGSQILKVCVFDAAASLLLQFDKPVLNADGLLKPDITILKPGLYFISVHSDDDISVFKVIKY